MNLSIQSLVMLGLIAFSIILTVRSVFINKGLDEAMDPIISGISTLITFFIVITCYERLDSEISKLLIKYLPGEINDIGIVHIITLGIAFVLLKLIIEFILNTLNKILFANSIANKKNRLVIGIFSIVFGFIRGIIFIVLLFMCISIYNSMASDNKQLKFFETSKIYTKVSDIVDKSQVASMSNDLQEKVASNKIIYYNGITIDEGVLSNDAINNKALEITEGEKSDKAKVKTLYTWIGSNISYDDSKAKKILEEGKECESGAIVTFNTRKGICLDYACLYAAMAKACGLKVRVIVGQAYNGEEYVGHAWNQVYIPKEDRWINVDPTFYKAGDYFDSSKFESQYKQTSVAGEF
ncbi:Transglutaminase-like superfamily protein [Clostridium sp. DSM 8431]|uniref:transglutaminase domain-containing protein n=1 Tax=Clostridium sp. DSM 8431 TaxID=1761781 RepID=UPI0008E4E5A0|nr:transglutaminase domain-containing protein [Clostridium sp. DSM 8431]SFU73644.1 Transglutaminase-like superfamily protein [Clostridium sp. DSM 8431]